jgi:hypothetical protein
MPLRQLAAILQLHPKAGMDAEAAKVAAVRVAKALLKTGRIRSIIKESAAERSRVRGSLA